MKSDKMPQVMSLKSVSVGAEDYKFEKEKNLEVWSNKEFIRPLQPESSSLLEAHGLRLHQSLVE